MRRTGPALHKLLIREESPYRKTIAMAESYKFRRRPRIDRHRILIHRGIHRVILRALNELALNMQRTFIEPQYRHSLRYPFPGMNISTVTSHINNRLWERGWCVALDSFETRDFLKEHFFSRMIEHNAYPVIQDDETDASTSFT